MILVLVLVMVVFFILGYQVHKMQINESSTEYKFKLSELNKKKSHLDELQKEAEIEKKRLKEQSDVLQVNFNNRWKEVEARINENDQLKNQLFLMKEKSKELDHIKEDFSNKWKEVEYRIHENDELKNEIYRLQQKCTCRFENGK